MLKQKTREQTQDVSVREETKTTGQAGILTGCLLLKTKQLAWAIVNVTCDRCHWEDKSIMGPLSAKCQGVRV